MSDTVERHWAPGEAGTLMARIDAALAESGRDPSRLTPDDLASVDEFHVRGREATEELAELAGVEAGLEVIDVGSGLGGPSRFLASRVGCRISGVDLTGEYCRVASSLAERTGLDHLVDYRQADALDLPFEDGRFDLAWTQHISMNVADKARMFGEMFRVLRPGGRAAIYDPIAGSGEPLTYPVPWARDPSISFLIDADQTRATLEGVGFRIEEWRDVSRKAIEWFERAASRSGPAPVLGLHLLLGPEWPLMARNMAQNIAAGRVALVQVLARRD